MTREPPVVLHVAPHPDDELLAAPATLMALRDAGWRVVNLACSLGRADDADRRRAELSEACRRARFELVIPSALPPIGLADDLPSAQESLMAEMRRTIRRLNPTLLVGPSPEDGHHGHEVVGRAIVSAVEAVSREPAQVMFWGLWRDLPAPNVLVPFGPERLAEIQHALAAHAGELERNRFDQLLEGRALAQAVLGSERVFGYGSRGIPEPYADLLTHTVWSPRTGWQAAPARMFAVSDPFGAS